MFITSLIIFLSTTLKQNCKFFYSTERKGSGKANKKVKLSEINNILISEQPPIGPIKNDADLKRELKIRDNLHFFDEREMGFIKRIGDGIAFVVGMTGVAAGELIRIPQANNMQGMALNLEFEGVGIVLFGNDQKVSETFLVCRTHKTVYVNVGFFLLGRVLDGLGAAIDNLGVFDKGLELIVDVKAPGIIARKSVHEPMQTG